MSWESKMGPQMETLRASIESVPPVAAAEAIDRVGHRHRRRLRTVASATAAVVVVTAAGVALVSGIGEGDDDRDRTVVAAPQVTDPAEAVRTALGTGGSAGGDVASTTIEGYLPNALYDGPGGVRSVLERVVVGTAGELTSIRAYGVAGTPGANDAQSRVLPTDHADVEFREVEVVLEVERDLGNREAAGPLTIGFTLPSDVDPEGFAEGLRQFGRVVWFLGPTVTPDDDPSVLTPGFQSRLLAPVAADGSLSLPHIEKSFAQSLLRKVNQIDALVRASEAPPEVRQRGT